MKTLLKRIVYTAVAAVIAATLFSGCSDVGRVATPPPAEPKNDLSDTYVFIGKDIQNPYMQKVYEGLEVACSEFGKDSLYKASESATAEKQIEIINELITQKVAGIAVAANDADALEESLKTAMSEGIKVISLDSAVNPLSRQTHIQQADPEKIGRELIKSAYEITGGKGGVAILSSTEQATNQNLWISYMNKEIAENPEKYASMPIITVAYGDDDVMKSRTETQALLKNSAIKVIISPTSVGMMAAGEVIKEEESDVKLTGLGMPSEMAVYIEEGICPQMYLWNPVDIGYLAGYTMEALVNGTISGAVGDSFEAGVLGNRTITDDGAQGSEVMLGDLLKFDATNIHEWKNEY